jgi:hypothetical protein
VSLNLDNKSKEEGKRKQSHYGTKDKPVCAKCQGRTAKTCQAQAGESVTMVKDEEDIVNV